MKKRGVQRWAAFSLEAVSIKRGDTLRLAGPLLVRTERFPEDGDRSSFKKRQVRNDGGRRARKSRADALIRVGLSWSRGREVPNRSGNNKKAT